MLAAMCAVLGYLAIDMNVIKITFESVPIIMAALMFGPLDGIAVGGIGTLLYQVIRYGITVTTPLWILPYVLCGLIIGLFAKKHDFNLTQRQTLIIVVLTELMITVLNTGTMYVDAKIFAYWFPGFISAALAIRLIVCVVKAVAYAYLLPPLIKSISAQRT